MKKYTISKMFLYRHRFGIVYTLLALVFGFIIIFFPSITPNGLSEAEMDSVNVSMAIKKDSLLSSDIIDLPYHLLQKASIVFFGFSTYSIKLPSIILGAVLGLLFVLLLNRWFKNNVAIISSVITVLSSSFLYIVGSGTPLIMVVFWPTLLFWLGSKIQGENKPKPLYSFIFAFALLLSLFTPYMIYLAIFIVFYALFHPHLRFTITHLPKIPFFLSTVIVLGVGAFLVMNMTKSAETAPDLFLMKDFSWKNYLKNISSAFIPFFKWNGMHESTFLAPLIGLASLALAITGLISTYHGFFASRNSIATYLAAFTVAISGLNPNYAILLLLPLAILIAHGFRYILNKWYSLFPENPYARIFGMLPISIFLIIIITSDICHFVFGYRYNPAVANNFNNDIILITNKVEEGSTLVVLNEKEYNFYKNLEQKPIFEVVKKKNYTVVNHIPTEPAKNLATLGMIEDDINDDEAKLLDNYNLDHIVTNSKLENSDRIYIYKNYEK